MYKYLRCLHINLFLCFKSKEKQKGYLLREELIATVGIAEHKDFAFIDDDLFACRPNWSRSQGAKRHHGLIDAGHSC